MDDDSDPPGRDPTIGQAMVPVSLLIVMLASSVYLFGDESSSGPNQIALILATGTAVLVALLNGHRWKDLERGISRGLSVSMGAILILLVVGSVIGTWILAGVVPAMIYYGLSVLSPSIFYAAACAVCAVVALATGSSWTTAGTIGIALIGIATAQNLHLGLAAGAIISGAYFGDKMSPLSDTTNLAPAVAGTDLFAHIRHMVWTTTPSIAIALILFALAGRFTTTPQDTDELTAVLRTLDEQFVVGPHLLLPLVIVLTLVIRRVPALPALLIGALVGGVFAVVFQRDVVLAYVGEPTLPEAVALVKGVWMALYAGFELHSGNAALDDLLSRGGMSSMLTTVWLIMTAMTFGAVMETAGFLQVIAVRILRFVRGTGSLISATLLTSFGMNVLASDQYIAIVLPGRMFRSEYVRRRLDPKNLSRTLEDSGTLTSVLIPWNTCGAFMAQTLGVSTLTYAPFAFFNILSPLVAAVYGFAHIGIAQSLEEPATKSLGDGELDVGPG
jgi:NhaC family Na+:H+ antiporter